MTLLKIKTRDLPESEKSVSLICDEMSLKSKIEYDMTTQTYFGYVTTPLSKKMLRQKKDEEKPDRAYHALSVMIVSLLGKWKQLIDFHFTGRSFDAKAVAKWLKEIIAELIDAVPLLGFVELGQDDLLEATGALIRQMNELILCIFLKFKS